MKKRIFYSITGVALVTVFVFEILTYALAYTWLAAVVVVCLVLLFAKYLTGKIISPLNNVHSASYSELEHYQNKIEAGQKYIQEQRDILRQKTEEFNVITQNIGDGFVFLSTQGDIISINKKASTILDIQKKDANINIIEANRTPLLITAIEKAIKGQGSEIIMPIKERHYILHISPVYNLSIVRGVVVLMIDNTQKAEAEKIRQEFFSNVSHELKTPLSSVSGYAELIKSGLVRPEDIQGFSEKIYNEAQILLALIEDIIKISKIDEGLREQSRENVNLKEIAVETIDRLEIIAGQKNIEITSYLEDISVFGIKNILAETVYNLVENAIKYNVVDGKIDVRLYTNQSEIVLTVADTGIGIPEESLGRVFERFYRVDTSHSKTTKGTGLGLSIVKHAVNLHGGKVSVTSKVGKGTQVEVRFFA